MTEFPLRKYVLFGRTDFIYLDERQDNMQELSGGHVEAATTKFRRTITNTSAQREREVDSIWLLYP